MQAVTAPPGSPAGLPTVALANWLGEETLILRTEESVPTPRPGDMQQVRPRLDRVHAFDVATGLRR
jgi:hypothetical protein